MGKILYHYTNLHAALEYILPEAKLKFGDFTGANDPKESKAWFFNFYSTDKIETLNNGLNKLISSIMPNNPFLKYEDKFDTMINAKMERKLFNYRKTNIEISKINKTDRPKTQENKIFFLMPTEEEKNLNREEFILKATNELKRRIKFISFTSTQNDEFGYKKPRMWAQYGETGRGICLAFDKNKLKKIVNKEYKGKIYDSKVQYENLEGMKVPVIESKCFFQWILESERLRNFYLFTKMEDWKEESEYRIILYNENNHPTENLLFNFRDSLKEIILGCDFPTKAYKPCLVQYAKEFNAEISQISWENGIAKKERWL